MSVLVVVHVVVEIAVDNGAVPDPRGARDVPGPLLEGRVEAERGLQELLLQAAALPVQGGHTTVAVRYSGRVHIVYRSFTFALGPPGRPPWATFPPACAWPQLLLPPSS